VLRGCAAVGDVTAPERIRQIFQEEERCPTKAPIQLINPDGVTSPALLLSE
jgi:hypothetical protein